MVTMSKRISALVALAATILALGAAAPPAHADPAANSGLYGRGDATFDGVFRQSLGILGLVANDVKPGKAAITWLLRQQCADGSFQAYRPDPSKACAVSDPVNYTGPDTNTTALALSALLAVDQAASADAAAVWLAKHQSKDGGWPWFLGSATDPASTGLVLSALMGEAPSRQVPSYRKATRYLNRLAVSCASGGGLSYERGAAADPLATAQGFLGLVATLPVSGSSSIKLTANPTCGRSATDAAGSYLATKIMGTGALPSAFGSDPDYTSTSFAVLGFVANSNGRQAVTKGTATLVANASAYAMPAGAANPGALGLLLLVSEATNMKPTNFGGINLINALQQSQQ